MLDEAKKILQMKVDDYERTRPEVDLATALAKHASAVTQLERQLKEALFDYNAERLLAVAKIAKGPLLARISPSARIRLAP